MFFITTSHLLRPFLCDRTHHLLWEIALKSEQITPDSCILVRWASTPCPQPEHWIQSHRNAYLPWTSVLLWRVHTGKSSYFCQSLLILIRCPFLSTVPEWLYTAACLVICYALKPRYIFLNYCILPWVRLISFKVDWERHWYFVRPRERTL